MGNRIVSYITDLFNDIKGLWEVLLVNGGLLLAFLGAIYQGVMLIKFGGLYYFSGSQLLTDALILLVFSFPFLIGFLIGKGMSLLLRNMSTVFSFFISALFYSLVLIGVSWSTVIYQLIINDLVMMLIIFLVGLSVGKIFSQVNKYYLFLFLFIFGVSFSVLNTAVNPFRFDRLVVLSDGFKGEYELKYQNDKYLFVTNRQDSKPMIISSANLEYYIISNKPNISSQIAKYALDKMTE